MVSAESKSVIDRASKIYSERLEKQLEPEHLNRYVAIEPDSGDYFIADSFSAAVAEARKAHPNRLSFVARVGHEAALHIGGSTN